MTNRENKFKEEKNNTHSNVLQFLRILVHRDHQWVDREKKEEKKTPSQYQLFEIQAKY